MAQMSRMEATSDMIPTAIHVQERGFLAKFEHGDIAGKRHRRGERHRTPERDAAVTQISAVLSFPRGTLRFPRGAAIAADGAGHEVITQRLFGQWKEKIWRNTVNGIAKGQPSVT